MANPAALTLTEIPEAGAVSRPAGDAIDTNGQVPLACGGATERVLLEVVNTDDAALTVKVKAGHSERAPIGDLTVELAASGGGATANRLIGGLESARFQQPGGGLLLEFTAATGAPACTVRAYKLPRAV